MSTVDKKQPDPNLKSWFPDVPSWLQSQIASSGQPTDTWHLNSPVIQAFLENPSSSIPTSAPPAPMETAAPNYGTIPANLGYGVQDYAGSTREVGNPFRYDAGYSYFGGAVPARSAIFLRGGLPGEGEWYKLTNSFTAKVLAAGLPLQDIIGVNLDQWGLVYGAQFDVNGQITDLGYISHGNMWGEGVNPWNPPGGGGSYRRHHLGGSGHNVSFSNAYSSLYPLVGGVTGQDVGYGPDMMPAGTYFSPWSVARSAAGGALLGTMRLQDAAAYSSYEAARPAAGLWSANTYQEPGIIAEMGLPTPIGALVPSSWGWGAAYTPGYADTPDWVVGASEYRSMNFLNALAGARAGGLAPSFIAGGAEWAYRGGMLGPNPDDRFQFGTSQAYYAGKAQQANSGIAPSYWDAYYGAESAAYGAMGGIATSEVGWYGVQASSYFWGDQGFGADVRLYGWIFAGAAQGLAIGAATAPYMRAMYAANPAKTEELVAGQSYLGMAYGYPSPGAALMQNIGLWGLGYGGIQAGISGRGLGSFAKSLLTVTAILGGASLLEQTAVSAWNRYQAGMPIVPPGQEGVNFYEDIGLGVGLLSVGSVGAYATSQSVSELGSAGQLARRPVGTGAYAGAIAGAAAFFGMEALRPYAVHAIEQTSGRPADQAQAIYTLGYELPVVMGSQILGARYGGPLISQAAGAVADYLPENITGALGGLGGQFAGIEGAVLVQSPAQYSRSMNTMAGWAQGIPGIGPAIAGGLEWLGNAYANLPGWMHLPGTFPDLQEPAANPAVPNLGPYTQEEINAQNAAYLNSPYGKYRTTLQENYANYLSERAGAQAFVGAFELFSPAVQQHLEEIGFSNPSMVSGAMTRETNWRTKYGGVPPSLADFMLGEIGAAAAQGTLGFPGTSAIVAWARSISIPVVTTGPYPTRRGIEGPSGPNMPGFTASVQERTMFNVWGSYQTEFSKYTGMSFSDLYGMEHSQFNPNDPPTGDHMGSIVGYDTSTGRPIYASTLLRSQASQYTGWQPGYSGLGPTSGWNLYGGPPSAAPAQIPGFSYAYSGVLTYGGNLLSPGGDPYNVPSFGLQSGALNVGQLIPYGPAVFGYQFPTAVGTNIPAAGSPSGRNMLIGLMANQGLLQGVDQRTGLVGPQIDLSVNYGGNYVYRPTQPLTLDQINYIDSLGFNVTPGTQPGGLYTPGTSFSWQYGSQFGYLVPHGAQGYHGGAVGVGVDPTSYEGKSLITHGWWWDGKNWHLPGDPKPGVDPRGIERLAPGPVSSKPVSPSVGTGIGHHYEAGPKTTNESVPLINQVTQHLILPEQAPTGMTEADMEVIANRVVNRAADHGVIMRGTDRIDHLTGKRFVKQIWPNLGQESYQKGSR